MTQLVKNMWESEVYVSATKGIYTILFTQNKVMWNRLCIDELDNKSSLRHPLLILSFKRQKVNSKNFFILQKRVLNWNKQHTKFKEFIIMCSLINKCNVLWINHADGKFAKWYFTFLRAPYSCDVWSIWCCMEYAKTGQGIKKRFCLFLQ